MATFCDSCGKQMGFFSSKRKIRVDGIEKVFCKSCADHNVTQGTGSKNGEAASGAVKPGAAKLKIAGSLEERIQRFIDETPKGTPWARLVRAALKDVLIYGPEEDGAREAMTMVLSRLDKFSEDDKGTILATMARYSLEVLSDLGEAKKHGRQTLLSARTDEAKHEAYLVLAMVDKAQGDKSKAIAQVQKALSLDVNQEARAKAERVKKTLTIDAS